MRHRQTSPKCLLDLLKLAGPDGLTIESLPNFNNEIAPGSRAPSLCAHLNLPA